MIPKAEITEIAAQQELLSTTIEKDYVLGWLLFAIAEHDKLSRWVFKGGTCLKKCFFETHRFSEDLDFTILPNEPYEAEFIQSGLTEVAQWVEENAGIQFPRDRIEVERYDNKRGHVSFQAKVSYSGPLNLPRRSLQRVKFDLTRDELVADETVLREIFHPYSDSLDSTPSVQCYSVNEVIAEKARALYERQGRARDVYDLVHLSRNFRDAADAIRIARVARAKFACKGLPEPSVGLIVDRVELDTLAANWENQLRHQLPILPPVKGFVDELHESIAWWLQPEIARIPLQPVPGRRGERVAPRLMFPTVPGSRLGRGKLLSEGQVSVGPGDLALNRIRQAARNHLCARVSYHGASRIVEPYSLRYPATGNILLYVFELRRDGSPTRLIKAYKVDEIELATVTDQSFTPRHMIEL